MHADFEPAGTVNREEMLDYLDEVHARCHHHLGRLNGLLRYRADVVIPDQLFERLDRAARSEGLSRVEDLLMRMSESMSGNDRQEAVAQIRDLRQRLQAKYGEMPDSTDLIREDRDR